MDKLKEQLAPVQKHLFWIGCGLVLVVTVFSWYSATSNLKSEQARLKSEIDGKVGTVNAIPENHPNDNTLKGMDSLILAEGEEVAKKWERLTENQKSVLVWPKRFDEEFISKVDPLRPPELKVTGQFITEIPEDDRRYYRNYMDLVFPGLAKIIGTKWAGKVQEGAGGMGGMAGMAGGMGGMGGPGMSSGDAGAMPGMGDAMGMSNRGEEDDSIVLWNSGNQSEILSNHFGFIARDDGLPTTLEILYAQEDLWVLESIMNIIKATNESNGPISHRHEAAIKALDSVTIGQSAVKEAGKISNIGGGSGGGGDGAPGMDEMAGGGMPGMAGGGGMAGMAGGGMEAGGDGMAPGADGAGSAGMMMPGASGMPGMGDAVGGTRAPGDNRYVDRDFKPVLSKRLIAAMKGQPEKPEDLFLAVAKRVPVRLNLRMDQRQLHTLLAACSNSRLPVEVKQLRINRQGGGGMGGDAGGGMMDQGSMMQGMMGGGAMGGMPGGDDAASAFGMGDNAGSTNNPARQKLQDSTIDANAITLELYGIVYIYNPVNRAVLGLPEENAAPPAGTTPVPTPASNPPPAATTPAPNTGAVLNPAALNAGVN